MKITNKPVEVPENCELNDKDNMNRCLSYLKELEKNYTVALTEASNEYLYNRYYKQYEMISKMQREIYELMFQYGWYELTTSEIKDITNCYDKLVKDYNSLCK